jgi:hypothetical protein
MKSRSGCIQLGANRGGSRLTRDVRFPFDRIKDATLYQ